MRKWLLLALVVVWTSAASPTPAHAEQPTPQAAVALAQRDVNVFWSNVLADWNVSSRPPALRWYNTAQGPGRIRTPCGRIMVNNAAYCSANGTIYLDARFARHFFETVGDYALFTIIAHEWGHHVQHLTGIDRDYQRGRLTGKQIELQADYWAGVYTRSAERRGILEAGDLEEALTITRAAGDMPGAEPNRGRPHGTAQERYDAFLSGYQSGDPEQC